MTIFLDDLPYLPYQEIGKRASDFLREKQRFDSLPIDIEIIVESDLSLNIIPVQNLRTVIGTEAFLSSDLRDICVDRTAFESNSYLHRFRFTLAHEVGHYVLHGHIYKRYAFQVSDEWKEWVSLLHEEHRFWLERHANDFAGHLLIPTEHLMREFNLLLPEAKEKAAQAREMGTTDTDVLDWATGWIAHRMSRLFEVSNTVVETRLRKEKLVERVLK